MYKNQLQELAQRSCFNLPSYTCIREGPDHAPRFKATVKFNGETYDCPSYCTTLRQAEHSAAEVALNALSSRGPTNSLAARILDETGIYKNLLQEVSQRVGASLPTYTTFRSGLGHFPVFTCTVELAGVMFTGEPAKNKKQAEKNAAMAAWVSLKLLVQQSENLLLQKVKNDEQEHVTVARALQKYLIRAKISNIPFPVRFPMLRPRPASPQPPSATTSKILSLISPKTTPRSKPVGSAVSNSPVYSRMILDHGPANVSRNDIFECADSSLPNQPMFTTVNDLLVPSSESPRFLPQKFPAAGAAPYIPVSHCRPHHGIAPPVTTRNAIPVYSAPPLPPPGQSAQMRRSPPMGVASAVCIRQVVPAFAAPVSAEDSTAFKTIIPAPAQVEEFLPALKAPNTPPVREEGPPTLKDPITSPVRVENLRTSKSLLATWPVQVENQSISWPSTISSTVSAQDPHTCKATVNSPPNSSMPLEESPESVVIEELKELKV